MSFSGEETTENLIQNTQRRKYPFINDEAVVEKKF